MKYPHIHRLVAQAYPRHADEIMQALGTLPQCEVPTKKPHSLYVTYADAFSQNAAPGTFATLTQHLHHITALGCDGIHVLPFLSSPCIDGGFDISDYYTVREELGGNEAFEAFLKAAQQEGVTVFMDLVLNHISDQHEWFRKALAGDKHYMRFFTHTDSRPPFVRAVHDGTGAHALYSFPQGEAKIRIVFPDQAGNIPHYTHRTNGWYYHTFYPHQIDVDWNNPHVFAEFAKVLIYWAAKGLSFRLDAIPFLGKDVERGVLDSSENMHAIVAALHALATAVNPHCEFLAEACTSLDCAVTYYGTQQPEADLVYNFTLCAATWATLATCDTKHVYGVLQQPLVVPSWGRWVTFLRNHDTLAHKFLPQEQSVLIEEAFMHLGLPFAKRNEIAGRTASFLDDNIERIINAHALLASIPGVPAVLYGDECAKKIDIAFMREQTKRKQAHSALPVHDDAREANRGYVSTEELSTPQAQLIKRAIGTLLHTRMHYLFTEPVVLSHAPKYLFAVQYRQDTGNLIVLVNTAAVTATLQVDANSSVLALNNARFEHGRAVLPPYGVLWLMR